MSVRAAVVVPVLVPALTKQPIPPAHARALTNLVGTAGNAISDRVVTIMSALEKSKQLNEDGATATALDEALEALFASIKDTAGLNSIMMHLLGLAKNADPERRISACILYSTFCQNATTDHSDFDVDFLRQLVPLLDDKSDEVVQAAWKALTALVATLSKEGMESLSVPLRRTIENTGGDQKVPGFCLPNGIKSLMRALFEYTWAQDIDLTTSVIEAIFLQGLLAGTAEQREQSAYGFGDLVERTTPEGSWQLCLLGVTVSDIFSFSYQAICCADHRSLDSHSWRAGAGSCKDGHPHFFDDAFGAHSCTDQAVLPADPTHVCEKPFRCHEQLCENEGWAWARGAHGTPAAYRPADYRTGERSHAAR